MKMAVLVLLFCSLLALTSAFPDDKPEEIADMMYFDEEPAGAEDDNPEPDADMMYFEEVPDTAVAEDVIPDYEENAVEEMDVEVKQGLLNINPLIRPVHQYYREKVDRYYYTTDPRDIGTTTIGDTGRYDFKYQGVAFRISLIRFLGMVPLYRLFNKAGGHVYTTSASEVRTLLSKGHIFGGPVVGNGPKYIGYCYFKPKTGTVPLIRWTRGNFPKYYTIYTINNTPQNISIMKKKGYSYSGITCYVFR